MDKPSNVFQQLWARINRGHKRSVKAKKNILVSIFMKGMNIAIGFALVPMLIGYLGKSDYGIWVVIGSVVTWARFFDVGLGHGLRNKLAEALAKGEQDLARKYVSTAYGSLAVILGAVLILFSLINPFLDWAGLLNASPETTANLSAVVMIIFGYFSINLVLKLVNSVVQADQRPALVGVFDFFINIITLGIIFGLTQFTEGSLANVALVRGGGVMFLVLIVASVFLYSKDYRMYRPSLRYFDFKYFNELISLGSQFFVIQIIGIIIFSTDNVIISRLFGPEEVTPYHAAFKYFGVVTMGYTIIAGPFWSAFTEAYNKGEYDWIRSSIKRLKQVWVLAALGAIVMLAASQWVYALWVGHQGVEIPWMLSIFMFLYVLLLAWGTPFVLFVNGVGKVRLQLIYSGVGGLINIPLSIFLAKYVGLGSSGVILATILSLSYGYIIAPIQYHKIMKGTAKGIWNK